MFDRLPELMRRLRLEQKLTQETLARTAEVSVSQVSRIEAGHQDPQLDTLSRMLEALGVTSFDDFCRLYRGIRQELDPHEEPAEASADLEHLGLDPHRGELEARLGPWLDRLPPGAHAAQLDFPSHVVYVLPKPKT